MNSHASGAALRRRHAILEIIRESPVRSQDELADRLRRRGMKVTQPTLSRDLRELRLVKSVDGYIAGDPPPVVLAPSARAAAPLEVTLRGFVLSIEPAGSLVVVRTPPAGAHPVARAIDEAGIDDVVGTIAGDDTLFLATTGAAAASRVVHRLRLALQPRRASRRRRA